MLAIGIPRRDEGHPQLGQGPAIALQDRRVQRAVHGGSHQHLGEALAQATQGGGQRRAHHRVGDASGQLGNGVGGGRSHQPGIERPPIREVFGPPGEGGDQRIQAGPLQRLAAHEVERRLGAEGRHLSAAAPQGSGQLRGFHGRNATADQQGDAFARQVVGELRHLVVADHGRAGGRERPLLESHANGSGGGQLGLALSADSECGR